MFLKFFDPLLSKEMYTSISTNILKDHRKNKENHQHTEVTQFLSLNHNNIKKEEEQEEEEKCSSRGPIRKMNFGSPKLDSQSRTMEWISIEASSAVGHASSAHQIIKKQKNKKLTLIILSTSNIFCSQTIWSMNYFYILNQVPKLSIYLPTFNFSPHCACFSCVSIFWNKSNNSFLLIYKESVSVVVFWLRALIVYHPQVFN